MRSCAGSRLWGWQGWLFHTGWPSLIRDVCHAGRASLSWLHDGPGTQQWNKTCAGQTAALSCIIGWCSQYVSPTKQLRHRDLLLRWTEPQVFLCSWNFRLWVLFIYFISISLNAVLVFTSVPHLIVLGLLQPHMSATLNGFWLLAGRKLYSFFLSLHLCVPLYLLQKCNCWNL